MEGGRGLFLPRGGKRGIVTLSRDHWKQADGAVRLLFLNRECTRGDNALRWKAMRTATYAPATAEKPRRGGAGQEGGLAVFRRWANARAVC